MATATAKSNGTLGAATSADLAAQVDILRQDVSLLTETLAELGKNKKNEAVNAAEAKVSEVREKVSDTAETARLQAMELQDQANDFIHKQPAAALGIAAGIGFLVGFLGTRK